MKTKKILLVDDDNINPAILMFILKEIGFIGENILTAEDGIKALEVLKNNSVDLIITDYVMPNMNGLDLIKTVKNDKNLFRIPIILNSGTPTSDLIQQALSFGACGFFPKPYDLERIKTEIKKAFTI